MRFVIVTGMSGAGKSSALHTLEDLGFFCVDNLPVAFLEDMMRISSRDEETTPRTAVVIDVRNRESPARLKSTLEELRVKGYHYEILFLECRDDVIIRRYKETRRNHPLSGVDGIHGAIAREREEMAYLKSRADYIIDTSMMLQRDLRREILQIFFADRAYRNFYITLLSFGYKYGIPEEADLIFDVRFLPNPFYVESLKHKTGNDRDVYDYVMRCEDAEVFLQKLMDMMEFLIPRYILEGKNGLVIGIGCTGGRHRSVAFANALYDKILELPYRANVRHRDADR